MNYEKLLEGKKALITAGADGIGYAIAKRFEKAGAKVFVCDINPEAVNKVNDVNDNIKAGNKVRTNIIAKNIAIPVKTPK